MGSTSWVFDIFEWNNCALCLDLVNINFGIPETSTLKQVRENFSHMTTEVNANDNADSIKALELRELIESKNGGPYIFKTLLRWCVVGPMHTQNKSE